MIGLDTNVLIRWITRDHPKTYRKVEQFLKDHQSEGFFLSVVVVLEVWWVLKKVYQYPEGRIIDVLINLCQAGDLHIEKHAEIQKSLEEYQSSSADFEDILISNVHLGEGCDYTVTLDKKAGRHKGMNLI